MQSITKQLLKSILLTSLIVFMSFQVYDAAAAPFTWSAWKQDGFSPITVGDIEITPFGTPNLLSSIITGPNVWLEAATVIEPLNEANSGPGTYGLRFHIPHNVTIYNIGSSDSLFLPFTVNVTSSNTTIIANNLAVTAPLDWFPPALNWPNTPADFVISEFYDNGLGTLSGLKEIYQVTPGEHAGEPWLSHQGLAPVYETNLSFSPQDSLTVGINATIAAGWTEPSTIDPLFGFPHIAFDVTFTTVTQEPPPIPDPVIPEPSTIFLLGVGLLGLVVLRRKRKK